MSRAWLTAALLLATAAPSAAIGAKTKVFVYTAVVNPDNGFGGFVPPALRDSVNDIQGAFWQILRLTNTKTRAEAVMIVEVVGREEVAGEFRVHVHITYDGREADYTGTSIHQWSRAAEAVAFQCAHWIHDESAKRAKQIGLGW